jgi:ribosome-associated translation inhibitor RaiA
MKAEVDMDIQVSFRHGTTTNALKSLLEGLARRLLDRLDRRGRARVVCGHEGHDADVEIVATIDGATQVARARGETIFEAATSAAAKLEAQVLRGRARRIDQRRRGGGPQPSA